MCLKHYEHARQECEMIIFPFNLLDKAIYLMIDRKRYKSSKKLIERRSQIDHWSRIDHWSLYTLSYNRYEHYLPKFGFMPTNQCEVRIMHVLVLVWFDA